MPATDRVAPGGVATVNGDGTIQELDLGANHYFIFKFRGQGGRYIDYAIDVGDWGGLGTNPVQDGLLRIGARYGGTGEPIFYPVEDAGVRFRVSSSTILSPAEFVNDSLYSTMFGHAVNTDAMGAIESVDLTYADVYDNWVGNRRYRLSIEGNAIKIEVDDTNGDTRGVLNYAGFAPGGSTTAGVVDVTLPYCPWPLGKFRPTLSGGALPIYFGLYVDPFASSSLKVEPFRHHLGSDSLGVGNYSENILDTDDHVEPLSEVVYLTVSDDPIEVAPRAHVSPSPSRDDLNSLTVFDEWGQKEKYQEHAGVEVRWTAPAGTTGTAEITGTYQAADKASSSISDCEGQSAIRLHVRKESPAGTEILDDIIVDTTQQQAFNLATTIAAGDAITFRVDAAGYSLCDGMDLQPIISWDSEEYVLLDDYPDASGIAWSFYEFFEDRTEELELNGNQYESNVGSTVFGQAAAVSPVLFQGTPIQIAIDPPEMPARSGQQWVRRLAERGLDNLGVIIHNWHKDGFEQAFPDLAPAASYLYSPNYSNDFSDIFDDAKALGYRIGLHENYQLMQDHPENEWWDATAIPVDSSGMTKFFDTNKCYIKNELAKGFFVTAGPDNDEGVDQIYEALYSPNLVFIDAASSNNPELMVDMDAGNSTPTTFAQAFRDRKEFLQALGNFDTGTESITRPVLGEGGTLRNAIWDTYLGGYVDGTDRQLRGGIQSLTLPDFELASVRPIMASHGMGQYTRYFALSAQGSGGEPMDEHDFDRYRAQTLAYGHAGYLGFEVEVDKFKSPQIDDLMYRYAVEYFMTQAVQQVTLDTSYAASVEYEIPGATGNPFDLAELMGTAGNSLRLHNARVTVGFDDGSSSLDVATNFSDGKERGLSVIDFSGVQGQHRWTHMADDGTGAFVEMEFDPLADSYRDDFDALLSDRRGTFQSASSEVARVYSVPSNGSYDINVLVHMVGGDAGDGVQVKVVTPSQDHGWNQIPGDAGFPDALEFSITESFLANDEVWVHVDPYGTATADGYYLNIEVAEASASTTADWSGFTVDGSVIVLPQYGFVVDSSPANVVGFSGTKSGDHMDYMRSSVYEFLRCREAFPVSHGGLRTDGAAALISRSITGLGSVDDVHMFQGTIVDRVPGPSAVLELSVAGSVNVRHVDDETLEISIGQLDGVATTSLDYYEVPSSFSSISVDETDAFGATGSPAFTYNSMTGELSLSTARAGSTYTINKL